MSIARRDFYTINDRLDEVLGRRWPYRQGELLICIDVECHCFNEIAIDLETGVVEKKRRVCEVGFTILDTEEVRKLAPGDRFQMAWNKLRSFNLAIKENMHMKDERHKSWCKVGCPDDFLFGKTQWVGKHEFRNAFMDVVNGFMPKKTKKPIVFLAFGGENDKKWLGTLDLDLDKDFPDAKFENIQQSTLCMMLEIRLGKHLISSDDLCKYLGIPTSNTHSGGNDAVFEMQAFLAPFAMTREHWITFFNGKPLPELPGNWKMNMQKLCQDMASLQLSKEGGI